MTVWRVTRTWLAVAETGQDAIAATAGEDTADVRAVVVGNPTGYAAGVFARHLQEREAYWRQTVGDEAWQDALDYWRQRMQE